MQRQHYLWLDSRFREGAGGQNLGELQQKFIAKKQEHSRALISVCWWAVDESRNIQAQHILQSYWLQTPSFGSNHDMFVTTCASMSGSTSYQLTISHFGNASCSCPNFYSQGGACKHLRAFRYVINAWTEKPFHYPQTLASAQEIACQTMSSKTSNLMAVVPESQLSPEPIDWAVIQALGGDSTILGNGLDEQGDTDSEAIVESPATSLDSDEDPLMDLNLFQHSAIGIQIKAVALPESPEISESSTVVEALSIQLTRPRTMASPHLTAPPPSRPISPISSLPMTTRKFRRTVSDSLPVLGEPLER
ncbi:hypothetical protein F5879DRAFT_995971 [Lentinula edodes]|nr:hypothetical protein F5879DRAFT_995971 [Lentinula edodes]